MQGDGHHEEQDVVDVAVVDMRFRLQPGDVVEVWRQVIQQIEEERSGQGAAGDNPPP